MSPCCAYSVLTSIVSSTCSSHYSCCAVPLGVYLSLYFTLFASSQLTDSDLLNDRNICKCNGSPTHSCSFLMHVSFLLFMFLPSSFNSKPAVSVTFTRHHDAEICLNVRFKAVVNTRYFTFSDKYHSIFLILLVLNTLFFHYCIFTFQRTYLTSF